MTSKQEIRGILILALVLEVFTGVCYFITLDFGILILLVVNSTTMVISSINLYKECKR